MMMMVLVSWFKIDIFRTVANLTTFLDSPSAQLRAEQSAAASALPVSAEEFADERGLNAPYRHGLIGDGSAGDGGNLGVPYGEPGNPWSLE